MVKEDDKDNFSYGQISLIYYKDWPLTWVKFVDSGSFDKKPLLV